MAHEPAPGSHSCVGQRLIVRRRGFFAMAPLTVAIVSLAAPADALELRVMQLRTTGPRLWAVLEVRDLLQDSFLRLVRGGRAVFLQLEADLWEDRRVFDRVVLTTPPRTWRIDQDPAGPGVLVLDQHGGSVRHADVRQPLALRLDLGSAARIDEAGTYYVNATLTAATVDERDIEQAGHAIFGEEQSASGLAGLGRFVFRTLLRMGKYFESATTEVTSRRVSGWDIRTGSF